MAKQTFTTGQVLTASQMSDLQQTAMTGGAASTKTVSYVLVAADAGTRVAMNAAGSTTITVNTGLFSAGDTVSIQNIGAGVCTVTAGTATVNTSGSLVLAQYQGGILYFTSASAAIFFQYATPESGDITAVTAGTGISGGGTSGAVTITNSMATEITAAGDIVVGTGSGTFDNLPIGSTGQVLTADTTVSPYKVKWADAASGSMTQLSQFTISGNQTISSIPATYRNLVVVMTALTPPNDNIYTIRMNNDSTANRHIYGSYTTSQNIAFNDTVWSLVNTQDSAVSQNITVLTIYEYANTTCWKLANILSASNNQTTTTNFNLQSGYCLYNQTTAISSLAFFNQVGGSSAGTVTLYGVK